MSARLASVASPPLGPGCHNGRSDQTPMASPAPNASTPPYYSSKIKPMKQHRPATPAKYSRLPRARTKLCTRLKARPIIIRISRTSSSKRSISSSIGFGSGLVSQNYRMDTPTMIHRRILRFFWLEELAARAIFFRITVRSSF